VIMAHQGQAFNLGEGHFQTGPTTYVGNVTVEKRRMQDQYDAEKNESHHQGDGFDDCMMGDESQPTKSEFAFNKPHIVLFLANIFSQDII
jgi:hypothetical protein